MIAIHIDDNHNVRITGDYQRLCERRRRKKGEPINIPDLFYHKTNGQDNMVIGKKGTREDITREFEKIEKWKFSYDPTFCSTEVFEKCGFHKAVHDVLYPKDIKAVLKKGKYTP